MKLIVGLGNPGKQYEKTRHNAGFMVMDEIAKSLGVDIDQKKFKGLYAQTFIKGEKVILLKPQTYMNNSGESVRAVVDYFNIDIEDILVIYDDLDLPVGKLRLREQGSAGGQKGVKSILQHLGTQELRRIRVGIGKDPVIPTVDYVLGKVSKEDLGVFQTAIVDAAKAAIESVNEDFNLVMAKFNKK
ncbi:PTH1 family peptidyl-tRNA hydrolase [Breznakia sp. PF5-3]|uniref:aminoacyl-tRNA hydrolase n=1 Tax=unclassified Breznakia TaxID=2623764 RepID=UPI002405DD7B|nr:MULTISPECIES: aminoacyl-tRNA hydrolase [unclassified Breznakia]MDF9825735.1 PTH1 family peptidyl-tRNA hydrolase [Breznakia sp. PM6-1]MDF9836081.1 PTH1 family peptidyl-tRNA hydrolase [Breznakia sp. PF5-3]MDF9838300.1 PTH1 family peptidyl-tRNA hydrolase [Breznakia sp. PFB2-8]MDF9860304.1 PTH1 family peptidyl-tRNA hydrolase [Breznakia sp. PH5-24]